MKWEPKPGYSTVGEKATKPTKELWVSIRPVEAFSMVAFVVVCVAALSSVFAVISMARFMSRLIAGK
jgi:hypothetical protein